MKKTRVLAIVIVLALLICLLPVTAMASGFPRPQFGKPGAADKETVETEEAEETAEEEEAVTVEEKEEDLAEEAEEPAAEAEEVTAEEEEAAEEEEPAEEEEEIPVNDVAVEEGESYYAASGEIVFNNGGTVYNNLAVVYNNGGIVYNNSGIVYNNGGVVYSNGGQVYNNGGTVYSNGALVYYFEGEVVESSIYGYYKLTMAEDYSSFVSVEGLLEEPGTGTDILDKDSVITVVPIPGIAIVDAQADAGEVSIDEDGNVVLQNVDADVTLTLTLQTDAPAFSMESGTYADTKTVEISGPESAVIYYTLDGEDPDPATAWCYDEPFDVEESAVVKAVAVIDGVENSEVKELAIAIPDFELPEFAEVKEGYKVQPTAKAITVKNEGPVDAEIVSVELTGDDADSFTLSTTKGKTIAAGKTDSSTWAIRPAAGLDKGEYLAEVLFTFDSGEQVTAAVTFTVTAGEVT